MTPEDTIRDLNHSWGHGLLLTLMLQGIDPRKLGFPSAPTVPIGLAAPVDASAAA
jgi:hypothetical protein